MTFALLPVRHDPGLIAAAIGIASFASYVALDLARRVHTDDRALARLWWLCGALAMGTGIWAMHFVAMLGVSLPIEIGFDATLTLASWAAGVAVSGLALGLAARERLSAPQRAGGALAMAAGICTMHYVGMQALVMQPGIVWDWRWVAVSIVIAVGASVASLTLFLRIRGLRGARGQVAQAGAALVMGLAISGMHYSAMEAAGFRDDAFCLAAGDLNGHRLGLMVGMATVLLLGVTLLTSVLDARMQGRTAGLAASLASSNAQLQAANDELQRLAFVDAMTGLPNRVLFDDRLAHAVARLERGARSGGAVEKLAVMFIDLDGFKPINDLWGHAVGDTVLKEAARRLAHFGRAADTLARIGGDEFVYLVEGLGAAAEAEAAMAAQRILAALQRPFELPGREVGLSASIGIAIHPGPGHHDKLVASADAAMYAVKRAGGSNYAIFDAQMDSGHGAQLELQNDLRRALAAGELALHYQPKVDTIGGMVHGVEALLRWTHPVLGPVAPADFIPLAERFGLIVAIGNWVIDEACRQMGEWNDAGLRMRVAINLSTYQLRQGDLVARIQRALERHGVEPAQLTCEIGEAAVMADTRSATQVLAALGAIGLQLAIDDFGSGATRLLSLRRLRVDQLKLARGIVEQIETSADALAVADATVRLGHALGLRVVAVGVETDGQAERLFQLHCDELQGFQFARPMPAARLLAWTRGAKPEGGVDFAPSLQMGLDVPL